MNPLKVIQEAVDYTSRAGNLDLAGDLQDAHAKAAEMIGALEQAEMALAQTESFRSSDALIHVRRVLARVKGGVAVDQLTARGVFWVAFGLALVALAARVLA